MSMVRSIYKKRLLSGAAVTCLVVLFLLTPQTPVRYNTRERTINANRLWPRILPISKTNSQNITDDENLDNYSVGHVRLENNKRMRKTCTPVVNVAFVKVHKAGGSTVTTILQRFGISRNLSFALPNKKFHSYGYNYICDAHTILTPSEIRPKPNGLRSGFNILCNHAVYNRTAFRMFMAPNTSFISILREPFQQFVSTFEYYSLKRSFASFNASISKSNNPISTFLEDPDNYESKSQLFSYVKNKQSQDLGFKEKHYLYDSEFDRYITQLDSDFTLVLILEHFDESLVLLKRKLCWTMKDILYIPKNRNWQKAKRKFTESGYRRHKSISPLDYKIYEHFSSRLERELKRQDVEFFEEVTYFRELRDLVEGNCKDSKPPTIAFEANKWHDMLGITRQDCELLKMSELEILDKLIKSANRERDKSFYEKTWGGINKRKVDLRLKYP